MCSVMTEKDGERIASNFTTCAEAVRDKTVTGAAVQLLKSFRVARKLSSPEICSDRRAGNKY